MQLPFSTAQQLMAYDNASNGLIISVRFNVRQHVITLNDRATQMKISQQFEHHPPNSLSKTDLGKCKEETCENQPHHVITHAPSIL